MPNIFLNVSNLLQRTTKKFEDGAASGLKMYDGQVSLYQIPFPVKSTTMTNCLAGVDILPAKIDKRYYLLNWYYAMRGTAATANYYCQIRCNLDGTQIIPAKIVMPDHVVTSQSGYVPLNILTDSNTTVFCASATGDGALECSVTYLEVPKDYV